MKLFKETNPQEIEAKLLGDGHVSTRMKHLNMVGNYITQLRGEEAVVWMEKAREVGASEAGIGGRWLHLYFNGWYSFMV